MLSTQLKVEHCVINSFFSDENRKSLTSKLQVLYQAKLEDRHFQTEMGSEIYFWIIG